MEYNNEKKFIYVNSIYDNEKAYNIKGVIKVNDDAPWTKISATIWKNKVNGEQTVAYKDIVEVPQLDTIKSIEAFITSSGEYNGVPQLRINQITDIVLLTSEEYKDKQDRLDKWRKENNKETPVKEVKQEELDLSYKNNDDKPNEDVPWEDVDL